MATRTLCRSALLRSRAAPIILGLSSGAFLLSNNARRHPYKLDSGYAATPFGSGVSLGGGRRTVVEKEEDGLLTADLVRQLSGGSLSGFLAGLLVSVFSKTLVLFAGMGIAVTQAAQSYGIDLLGMLRVKQLFKSSKVLTALMDRPAFNVAFGTTFALAAFFQF